MLAYPRNPFKVKVAGSIPVVGTMLYDKLYILIDAVPNFKLVDIIGWDVEKAQHIVAKIDRAYAFRFQRRLWTEDKSSGRIDIVAKIIKESSTYYINSYAETVDDIRARIELNRNNRTAKQLDELLVRKLEEHGCKTIVRSVNNYSYCCLLRDGDVVLDSI
jgi:hypothetical protein